MKWVWIIRDKEFFSSTDVLHSNNVMIHSVLPIAVRRAGMRHSTVVIALNAANMAWTRGVNLLDTNTNTMTI
jgi:hypothetical protein